MTSTNDNNDDAPQEELHLYFIGNSYTSSHQLARLTKQALTSNNNNTNVTEDAHSPPGEAFSGHLINVTGNGKKGTGHRLHRSMVHLKNRQWNWVILQNQSQLPAFIQDDPATYERTLQNAKQLYGYIRQHNPETRLLFLMTWGRRKFDKGNRHCFPDFLTMQAKLTAGYLQYVAETSTPENPTFVAPCGLVFQTIYQDLIEEGLDPTEAGSLFFGLFGKDGHHPSLAGSYTSAVTIYATLTGLDARQMEWVPEGLDSEIAGKLRDAVSRTIDETASTGLIRYPWQLM